MAKSSKASYARLPSTEKWEFTGIPVLPVNTHMPPTGPELELRTEMDFWETAVHDKSPRPMDGGTHVAAEQREVLFDANDDAWDAEEGAGNGLTQTKEPQAVSPRRFSPVGADHTAEASCDKLESRIWFQPQSTPDSYISRTQSGRILLSRAWPCCGIRSTQANEASEKP